MKKPFIGVFPDFGDKTLYLTYDYDWFADDMNLSIVELMKCYMIIIEGERPQHQVSPVTIDVKPWLGIHFFLMFKDCLPFNRNEFALLH